MFEDRRTEEGDVLRAVIDTVVDGLIITDRDGTIRIFNPAAESLFGYLPQEVVGRNVSLLMPHDPVPAHNGTGQADPSTAITAEKQRIMSAGREVTGRRKDGSAF